MFNAIVTFASLCAASPLPREREETIRYLLFKAALPYERSPANCQRAQDILSRRRHLNLWPSPYEPARAPLRDLYPLSFFPELLTLQLSKNALSDIRPLAKLTQLYHLELFQNKVGDLHALSQLTGLRSLGLSENEVIDLAPLQAVRGLRELNLTKNQVVSVRPLAGMRNLRRLWIGGNRINDLGVLKPLTMPHKDDGGETIALEIIGADQQHR